MLQTLRDFDALRDSAEDEYPDRVQVRTVTGVKPCYGPANELRRLRQDLREHLGVMGVERLYDHQAEAINRVGAGRDVIVVSPTASRRRNRRQPPRE